MNMILKTALLFLISLSFSSAVIAHCGSCGTGDNHKEKPTQKSHNHDHHHEDKHEKTKQDKTECDKTECDKTECDTSKGNKSDKPADKPADKPVE